MNTKANSTILLLCLDTEKSLRKPKDIMVSDLYDCFSKYGEVDKILIFSKSIIFKAFIELKKKEDAKSVISALHNVTLPQLGQIKLFYSAQERLKLSNKFVEYWDANQDKSQQNNDEIKTDISNQSRPSLITNNQIQPLQDFLSDNVKRRSTLKSNLSTDYTMVPQNEKGKSKSVFGLSPKIILDKGAEFVRRSQFINPSNIEKLTQENSTQNVPSKVVLISNLLNTFSTAQQLFNLFSCFGDINKIILMHNLQKALIEYSEFEGSKACLLHLTGVVVGNTKIKINYSKYKEIDVKKSFRNEASIQFNEILTVPSSQNRFGVNGLQEVKPISRKLLFEVEKKENVKIIDIYFYIEKFAEPDAIEVISTDDDNKMKLVVYFKKKSSALMIMSRFHRSEIKSAKIFISFS